MPGEYRLYTGKIQTLNGYRYITTPSASLEAASCALSQGLLKDETLVAVVRDIIKPVVMVDLLSKLGS